MSLDDRLRNAFRSHLDPIHTSPEPVEQLDHELARAAARVTRMRAIALSLALLTAGATAGLYAITRDDDPTGFSEEGPIVSLSPTPSEEPSEEPTPVRSSASPSPSPTPTLDALEPAEPIITVETEWSARYISQLHFYPGHVDDPNLAIEVRNLRTGERFAWRMPDRDPRQITLVDRDTVLYTVWDDTDYGESLVRVHRDGRREIVFDGSNQAAVRNYALGPDGEIALQLSRFTGEDTICFPQRFGILRPSGEFKELAGLVGHYPSGENHSHREETIRFSPDGTKLVANVWPGCDEMGTLMLDRQGTILNSVPQSRDPFMPRWLTNEQALVTVEGGTVLMKVDGTRELIHDERMTHGELSPDGRFFVHDTPGWSSGEGARIPDVTVRSAETLAVLAERESAMAPIWVDATLLILSAAISSEESVERGGEPCRDNPCADGVQVWNFETGKVRETALKETRHWGGYVDVSF